MSTPSSNFAFLTKLHPLWAELGSVAERVFPIDPRSCVVKMRLLAEDIAQDMAIQVGIQPSAFDSQLALVRELENRLRLDAKVRDIVDGVFKRTLTLLETNLDLLEQSAQDLLQRETLDEPYLVAIGSKVKRTEAVAA